MNAFVLRVFLTSRQTSNTSKKFLTNQVVMDTVSSLLLVVSFAFKLADRVYYEGGGGFAVCILLNTDAPVFVVQVGSIASLVLIAAERCLKVVFPAQHQRFYKNWMTYAAIAFAWTDGALMNLVVVFTTKVVDGQCLSWMFWISPIAGRAYSLFLVTWQFVTASCLLVVFYGAILSAVRKSNRVLEGSRTSDEAKRNARRGQMNIISTMCFISLSFGLCWAPNQVLVVLLSGGFVELNQVVYCLTMLLIFLNTCFNPFIYALKHEYVRKRLRAMVRSDPATNVTQIFTIDAE